MPAREIQRAWEAFNASTLALQQELLAASPDELAAAESAAYLARVTAATVERMFNPEWRSVDGLYYGALQLAAANPDYRMGQADLDPRGRYELSGSFHDADSIGVGLYSLLPGGGLDLDGYHRLVPRQGGAERFSLTLAASGADLALLPGTALLMVRELQRKPGRRAADIRLRRLDATQGSAAALPLPTPMAMVARIGAAQQQVAALVRRFLQWSLSFAATPNAFAPLDEALDREMRGDPGTRYYSGSFDLAPGELLEVEIPFVACDYWMIQATNHWLEPIAGAHLNDATARADGDGRLRVRIAAADVGTVNLLATGGRLRGALLYRTLGANRQAVPVTRRVAGAAGLAAPN